MNFDFSANGFASSLSLCGIAAGHVRRRVQLPILDACSDEVCRESEVTAFILT